MIVIEKENITELDNLSMHDSKVLEMICNYNEHKVIIPVEKDGISNIKRTAELIFEDVVYFDFSCFEPWGEGIYIYEIKITSKNEKLFDSCNSISGDKHFNIEILINSGDKFNILCSKFLYDS